MTASQPSNPSDASTATNTGTAHLRFPGDDQPLRLAVLLSGGGRTLQNIADRISAGELNAVVKVVIGSNPNAFGLERARRMNLPTFVYTRKQFNSPAELSDVLFDTIRQHEVDLIVLAGYLSLLVIPQDFAGRVINIHPALLPSFGGPGMYGHHVHEAVLSHGCKLSGCTVHFCDQTYDTGQIVTQKICPVLEDDTPDALAARVFEQECLAFPEALKLIAQGRVILHGRRAHILPEVAEIAERAKWFAEHALAGVHRFGRPAVIEHVRLVVKLLQDDGCTDPQTLAAGWLHDVLEDVPLVSIDQIRRAFGEPVASWVGSLTIPLEHRHSPESKQSWLIAHAGKLSPQSKRIKLADRLEHVLRINDRPADRRAWYVEQTRKLVQAMQPDAEARRLAERIERAIAG